MKFRQDKKQEQLVFQTSSRSYRFYRWFAFLFVYAIIQDLRRNWILRDKIIICGVLGTFASLTWFGLSVLYEKRIKITDRHIIIKKYLSQNKIEWENVKSLNFIWTKYSDLAVAAAHGRGMVGGSDMRGTGLCKVIIETFDRKYKIRLLVVSLTSIHYINQGIYKTSPLKILNFRDLQHPKTLEYFWGWKREGTELEENRTQMLLKDPHELFEKQP